MHQRLGIAQALVEEPNVLLLDEVTSALDPVGQPTVRRCSCFWPEIMNGLEQRLAQGGRVQGR